VKERLPINKSIFWSDLGLARKIYRNLAIIPRVQQGPTKQEIEKRVTQLIGRPSMMEFGSYEGVIPRDSIASTRNTKSKFHILRDDAIMQGINEGTPAMETIGEEQNDGSDENV
jgi:hypothetical protein